MKNVKNEQLVDLRKDKGCNRWSEIELVAYCLNELERSFAGAFERHLAQCADCRERFALCLSLILSDYSSGESDFAFISDPLWQKQKRETARRNAIAEQFPRKMRPAAVVLKIAAVILALLIPVISYPMLLKPLYEGKLNGLAASDDRIRSASDPSAISDLFESADLRLEENPQDWNALFERAAASEKLFLFEQAQKDYLRYILLNQESPRRVKAQERMSELSKRAVNPPVFSHNRYELLDQSIDDYLSALSDDNQEKASEALAGAERIAAEMHKSTGDQFGKDLVSYYRALPTNFVNEILEARKLRSEVEAMPADGDFSKPLEKAYIAKSVFAKFRAECDIELIDLQIAKYLIKNGELNSVEDLINSNVKRAQASIHLFTKAQFLHKRGVMLSDRSKFSDACRALEESIATASNLDVPGFLLLPEKALASIYYVSNENDRAFALAYQALREAHQLNNLSIPMQLTQLLGISAFNLNQRRLAETYLTQSVLLAEKRKNRNYQATSLSFLGVFKSEQKRFLEADGYFNKAARVLEEIPEQNAHNWTEFNITGYYARSQMLAGNTERAIALYNRALELADKTGVKQKLALSQLHQGLGECFIAKGDAKRAEFELAVAVALDDQARQLFETNNALLTFAVTRKDCREQLRLLKTSFIKQPN